LTEDEAAQVAAFMYIGAAVVPLFVVFFNNLVGKKWSMIMLGIPAMVGWLLIALSEGALPALYAGRLLTGFSGGAFVMTAPAYTAETAEPSIRGALSSLMQLSVTAGILLIAVIGCDISWQALSWICLVFPCVLVVWIFFMPRSPAFLVSKGKLKEARESLVFLRGKSYPVDQELKEIEEAQLTVNKVGSTSILRLVSRREYLSPFLISLTLMFVQQFSGVNYIASFVIQIFQKAGSSLDPCISTILVMVTQFLGVFVTVGIIDRFGRRILMVISTTMLSLSLLGLGVYFNLSDQQEANNSNNNNNTVFPLSADLSQPRVSAEVVDSLSFLPLLCLLLYSFFFSVGLGPVPWVLNIELFPQEARGLAASLCVSFNWACSYVVVYLGNMLGQELGSCTCFFIFSGVCAFGALFTLIWVPETKGRSEAEMRSYFLKKPDQVQSL